ncbi:hypothetical protein APTSU1_000269900 [Apodemus speciosus]|uniref:Uncharacterized protein n=1 Tax=Apodemus speciosus TaxID=105296 RepID=A0ABQ0EK91_APOSI
MFIARVIGVVRGLWLWLHYQYWILTTAHSGGRLER